MMKISPLASLQVGDKTIPLASIQVEGKTINDKECSPLRAPKKVLDAVTLRNPLIGWTQLNPRFKDNFCCCLNVGACLVLPCFEPHRLLLWPFQLFNSLKETNEIENTYWLLTTKELIISVLNNDGGCCIPGCYRTGVNIKTIPLENITDVGLVNCGKGMVCCGQDLPIIYVDTASSSAGNHEAVGFGLANYDLFIQQVLNARDAVKLGTVNIISRYINNNVNSSTTQHAMTDRGDINHSEDLIMEQRFEDLMKLHDNGHISHDEYKMKRKEILSSL